jgi:glycosyltransferase involved in cell wall biosynthesis
LLYLAQAPHEFILPVRPDRPHGYAGRAGPFPWPPNVHELPADLVRHLQLDCVLFQARGYHGQDQHELLSSEQRRLPRLYLEHDPPREHPTDQRHWVDDPDTLLVHVTPFNALMWDSGCAPSRVIDHGVTIPDEIRYTGEIARGLVIINNLGSRGRRLGLDVFERVRREIPLDLVGMGAVELGGLDEIPHDELPDFAARYRFLFNPIRYTSLGLAVCEAMLLGMPIVGLATTEMATAVENGVSGYVDTEVARLVERMRQILADPTEALRLGDGARRRAIERFSIERFARDCGAALKMACPVGRTEDRVPILRRPGGGPDLHRRWR